MPTYIFSLFYDRVGLPIFLLLSGVDLIITALFCFLFSKTVQAYCYIPTSGISVGLSALGVVCFLMWFSIASFDEMSRHPIAYPSPSFWGSDFACFGVGGVALVVTQLLKDRKYLSWLLYLILFFGNSIRTYLRLTWIFGIPSTDYTVYAVLTTDMILFDFRAFLLALQFGIFSCFLFWLGELILLKMKARKRKENISCEPK